MADDDRLTKLIPRINELAKKAKDNGLTDDEKTEQDKLRKEYLAIFRENLKSQVEMTKVYDEDGKEVTSDKVKKAQRDKNLRDD